MKYIQVKNQQKKACVKKLKDVFYQENKSIDINKQLHLTVPLAETFYKPAGEANPYLRFGYIPQIISNHTQVLVSGSMNSDPINTNKKVNSQCLQDQN